MTLNKVYHSKARILLIILVHFICTITLKQLKPRSLKIDTNYTVLHSGFFQRRNAISPLTYVICCKNVTTQSNKFSKNQEKKKKKNTIMFSLMHLWRTTCVRSWMQHKLMKLSKSMDVVHVKLYTAPASPCMSTQCEPLST